MRPRAPILSCAAAGCALCSLLNAATPWERVFDLEISSAHERLAAQAMRRRQPTNVLAAPIFKLRKFKRLELAAYEALANRSRQDPIRQMSSLDPDDAWDNGQLRTRVSICFQFQQRRPALRDDKTRGACQSLANPGPEAAPRDHGNQ